MGLMDILNGMQSGPRSASAGRGGTPPWMMAVLGLLAYKAMKGGALGNLLGANERGTPSQLPPAGGGLGDIVGQILGRGQNQLSGVTRRVRTDPDWEACSAAC